jgi:hypothetical protein
MTVIRDLGDGLVLRHATAADSEALVAFNADVHRDHGAREPDAGIAGWTRDLMTRPHPTVAVSDFTVVEDTRSGRIVSSLNLISQTWAYSGIPFGAGRIELVGTHPAYRRRGLVRAQLDIVHRWSAGRGELVQGITGIPWYYRQFGYEYALGLDGGRGGYLADIPPSTSGNQPERVRPATAADLPFIARLDEQSRGRYLVTCVRDAALWRYDLDGRGEQSGERAELCVVERASGEAVGFLVHSGRLSRSMVDVRSYELVPGVSWPAVTLCVLRYLRARGEAYAALPNAQSFNGFMFMLEQEHPVYEAIASRLPRIREAYAWYLRVPDLPGFVRRIAPALEARLAASPVAGYGGELRLNFYRDGLCLVFKRGRLVSAEPWPAADRNEASASFPDRTFLQILFGYRSLSELEYAFPDVLVSSDEARMLLTTLFPKQASFVRPIG